MTNQTVTGLESRGVWQRQRQRKIVAGLSNANNNMGAIVKAAVAVLNNIFKPVVSAKVVMRSQPNTKQRTEHGRH